MKLEYHGDVAGPGSPNEVHRYTAGDRAYLIFGTDRTGWQVAPERERGARFGPTIVRYAPTRTKCAQWLAAQLERDGKRPTTQSPVERARGRAEPGG